MADAGELFGKQEIREVAGPELTTMHDTCPHTTMVPRWDNADDIGKADRVSAYHCEGCNKLFTREEAEALRHTEKDRLQDTLG